MSDGGRQTGRAPAESLALAAPLAGCREQFAIPARPDGSPTVYLCGNSLGLMPNTAGAAVERVLEDWASYGVGAHFKEPTPGFSYHEMFRHTGARLVGAKPGEVVMMNSLTVNLHL
ncbi:MAG: kynureninase, partial [Acidobacteria bacterium]|nr:kynureninase [Acidobacteriota bacterium]